MHTYPPGNPPDKPTSTEVGDNFLGRTGLRKMILLNSFPTQKSKKEIYHILMLRNLKMIFPIFFNLGMNHFKPKKVKLTKKMPGDRPAGTKVGDRFEDSTCNTHTPTKHTRNVPATMRIQKWAWSVGSVDSLGNCEATSGSNLSTMRGQNGFSASSSGTTRCTNSLTTARSMFTFVFKHHSQVDALKYTGGGGIFKKAPSKYGMQNKTGRKVQKNAKKCNLYINSFRSSWGQSEKLETL